MSIRNNKLGLNYTLVSIPSRISKNCLKPRNFSWCPLWSSIPTARCKPRFLQLETLPQYVSHKALAQERSSTQSTTKKKGGGILISTKVLPCTYKHIHGI